MEHLQGLEWDDYLVSAPSNERQQAKGAVCWCILHLFASIQNQTPQKLEVFVSISGAKSGSGKFTFGFFNVEIH
jgi:hypothetical protein